MLAKDVTTGTQFCHGRHTVVATGNARWVPDGNGFPVVEIPFRYLSQDETSGYLTVPASTEMNG